MTNATPTGTGEATLGAFGETLEALMRSRGMVWPDEIRDLARRAGTDPDRMLTLTLDDSAVDLGDIKGLARELSLSEDEKTILATAYAWRKSGVKALRALQRDEKSLARLAVEDRGGLCFFGAGTDHPCEREATEPREWGRGGEITICAEHARAIRLADNKEELFTALEQLHEFIEHGAPSEDTPAASIVREGLYSQREQLERKYFDALVKERAATLVADGREAREPGVREYPASPEAAEALVRAHMISDALTSALAVVEDAPQEVIRRSYDRFEIAAVLQAAGEDASRVSREAERSSGLTYSLE